MKAPRSTVFSLLLSALCVAAVSGCTQKPEVTDLAESGWTIAEQPTPTREDQPKTISGLAAAGWHITPASLSEMQRQFGSGDSDWIAFKAKFKPGDTLVKLVAPDAYWAKSAGWSGYAIVRSGVVVATLAVLLS